MRWKTDEQAQAYTSSPRIGGIQIGVIQLTQAPYRENTRDMPESDYEAEGFAWLSRHPTAAPRRERYTFTRRGWEEWKAQSAEMWVVRFSLLSLTDAGLGIRAQHGEGDGCGNPMGMPSLL